MPLADALDVVLRFGGLLLRSGDTVFRVREALHVIAASLGIERLELHITVGGMTATARRGGERATLACEVGSLGIDAWRLSALERLARESRPGLTPSELTARLDAIEATPAIHSIIVVAVAVGLASSAFSWLNGGSLAGILAAFAAGGLGQAMRSLLFRHHLNQYAATAACAFMAAGLYWLIARLLGNAGLGTDHGVGVVSAVLFLVPGFPLVAALVDLLQRQTLGGVVRLAYGTTLLLAAAFGLGILVAVAGLTTVSPPAPSGNLAATLLWRGVASFVGGCGFAVLYNSAPRTVLAVGSLALLGNEARLALHDTGVSLALATFVGAVAVGLLASILCQKLDEPRLVLTVPGIIIMVPGAYAFQALVLFAQADVLGGLQAAVMAGFVVGAMALGLAAARFASERKWLFDS